VAGDVSLTGKYLLQAEKLLFHAANVLKNQSRNYWLEGGTLLGIVREDRLLPWDNDVDLSVMYDDVLNFDSMISALKKGGYRVRTRNVDVDCEYLQKGMPRVIKLRLNYFFGLFKSKVCLDIFVKYRSGNKVYWVVNGLVKSVPARFHKQFSTITFKNQLLSVPDDVHNYLEYRYGDWRQPVKQWNTFTDDKALEKEL